MGYEQKEIKIVAQVSRHNSERDVTDDALWKELENKISKLVNKKKYTSIWAMML